MNPSEPCAKSFISLRNYVFVCMFDMCFKALTLLLFCIVSIVHQCKTNLIMSVLHEWLAGKQDMVQDIELIRIELNLQQMLLEEEISF